MADNQPLLRDPAPPGYPPHPQQGNYPPQQGGYPPAPQQGYQQGGYQSTANQGVVMGGPSVFPEK